MNNVARLTVTDETQDFRDYIARTPEEALKIKPASDWADEVDYLLDNPINLQGDTLPWGKTWNNIRLRESELSVWCGINGHGKSSLNGQVLVWQAAEGKKIMIASMEMPPAKTLGRMIRQAAGGATPDKYWRDKFFKMMDGRLWFYDQLGSVDSKRIIEVTKYSADVLKCDHIQVDSITKVKGLREDYSGQADLVNELQSIAFDYKTHVHLIAHMRKGETENKIPGKFDLRGASDIADQADNIFIVWQNKPKISLNSAIQGGYKKIDNLTDSERELIGKPDTILNCAKQRHGEWEGNVVLWFGNNGAYQFVEREGANLVCKGFRSEDRFK